MYPNVLIIEVGNIAMRMSKHWHTFKMQQLYSGLSNVVRCEASTQKNNINYF